MEPAYVFEPAELEIILTNLLGNTILPGYYSNFVKSLEVEKNDKVLDYCSGSGMITKRIARQVKKGHLVFADVSQKWLKNTIQKLSRYENVQCLHINGFDGVLAGGEFDKIVLHYVLHDFPSAYRMRIINQMVRNLKRDGILFIREPISVQHGMELFELVNLLESSKILAYEYKVAKKPVFGDFVDIRSWIKEGSA